MIVFDTCSLVNLVNGRSLNEVLQLPGFQFSIGNIVLDEYSKVESQLNLLKPLLKKGFIRHIEEDVDINLFMQLKQKFQLGDGETESIAHCIQEGFSLSSDDSKARKSATSELGSVRVLGSIHLLRETVKNNIMKCDDAMAAYKIMILKGAFLPKIEKGYFCL